MSFHMYHNIVKLVKHRMLMDFRCLYVSHFWLQTPYASSIGKLILSIQVFFSQFHSVEQTSYLVFNACLSTFQFIQRCRAYLSLSQWHHFIVGLCVCLVELWTLLFFYTKHYNKTTIHQIAHNSRAIEITIIILTMNFFFFFNQIKRFFEWNNTRQSVSPLFI